VIRHALRWILLLRGRATFIGLVEATEQMAAIAAALNELDIPPHLRGKVSAQPD
jgi:hypothetical protein